MLRISLLSKDSDEELYFVEEALVLFFTLEIIITSIAKGKEYFLGFLFFTDVVAIGAAMITATVTSYEAYVWFSSLKMVMIIRVTRIIQVSLLLCNSAGPYGLATQKISTRIPEDHEQGARRCKEAVAAARATLAE